MIIGFSEKTSKILPKIFCKKFRHCAIIIEQRAKNIEHRYLFMHIVQNKIHTLPLSTRDLKILEKHGWVFVKTKHTFNESNIYALSCVGFVKRALGIKNPFIWTPDQLYRKLGKMEEV